MDHGKFGVYIINRYVNKGVVGQEEKVTFTLDGQAAYIYILLYKEPFPRTRPYTEEQLVRINNIWTALDHPEKIITDNK